jgi:hypothetical protein
MGKYDWNLINEKAKSKGAKFPTVADLGRFLLLPRTTLNDAFNRGDLVFEELIDENVEPTNSKPIISFKERGNEAVLKYKAAEPMELEDVLNLANVDRKVWKVTGQKINMWQMGRKDRKVSAVWTDGKKTGTEEDSGGINKSYLYQIDITMTRIKRVQVKLESLQPIELDFKPRVISNLPPIKRGIRVLFICDPHFGFHRKVEGLVPIHHRKFLGSLLNVASQEKPDVVVWNGDVLDLADFSTFDTAPDLLYTTQLAGMELGWVLGEFRGQARRQVVLEGNHEKRMSRMLIKHFAASYQLKPIHELDGDDLLSVPRFLGLDKIYTEWIGGYPSNYLKINSATFQHGNIVRKGSAKTVSALMTEAVGDRFFGHIHRMELAQKYIEDLDREIYVGSPGCSCDKRYTPGSDMGHNWQLGAFLIHLEPHRVASVETISSPLLGPVVFRGSRVESIDYMPEFLASIPKDYRSKF